MDIITSIVSWLCLYFAIALPMGLCLAHAVPTIDPSQNLPAFVRLIYINVSAGAITDKYIKLKLWKRHNEPV